MLNIPSKLKEPFKVIGYFSYGKDRLVFCDGDACIISGSETQMKFYIKKRGITEGKDIIKKTNFGEIVEGLSRGAAYAFDEEAYIRFLDHARKNAMEGLPQKEIFLEFQSEMHFIRIQIVG